MENQYSLPSTRKALHWKLFSLFLWIVLWLVAMMGRCWFCCVIIGAVVIKCGLTTVELPKRNKEEGGLSGGDFIFSASNSRSRILNKSGEERGGGGEQSAANEFRNIETNGTSGAWGLWDNRALGHWSIWGMEGEGWRRKRFSFLLIGGVPRLFLFLKLTFSLLDVEFLKRCLRKEWALVFSFRKNHTMLSRRNCRQLSVEVIWLIYLTLSTTF